MGTQREEGSARQTTASGLLRGSIAGRPEPRITLAALLAPLGERAFGVLLALLAIPNFVPLAVGIGGVMGVAVMVLGIQLALGATRPWLPGWAGRRQLDRHRLLRLLERLEPVTARIERICRPRLPATTRKPLSLVTGGMLVLLGLMLALPLPFTNYFFGALLLAFAFALIERDGALLLAVWALTLASAGVIGALGEIVFLLLREGIG
ncbi:MAG: exopolysaccharide biosynthesis protein [Xanthomonadaceae bacterium]|nr:exopolysaccharide biosynthesis protein [Xanthomonadaceae bacterium]MDE1963864.1 exopolysaccharide biosynthesis protein [Xanthomonadaceae bacterium]